MHFTKMEGCGNDYVYISGFDTAVDPDSKPELVKKLSDRHFGIGGDGVIFINPSEIADFEMEMWNADGTRGEMCGNGIRCVGKFVYDKGMTDKTEITVESFGKIKYLTLYTGEAGENPQKEGRQPVTAVRVNMGAPILDAADIPVRAEASPVVSVPIRIDEKTASGAGCAEGTGGASKEAGAEAGAGDYKMTCVSMGNPHAVVYIDDTENLEIEKIGPLFENHPLFPNRVNTEFVQILDRDHVKMRVWERGSGETLACGTGCCAICVAGVLNGVTAQKIEVQVLGGRLEIEWDREKNVVWMTGPATTAFEGTITV
ncbi:MAG: diaminopimelate epimerase [Eubacteriales bacterium]|nr:diaminopimelate epimerase [Eubacteriales bacterium]